MNPTYLSPIADHLWQSTLFAGVAGLLTLVLRTNYARVRYWLWLVASCKFLIPLSVLISLGGYIAWRTAPPTQSNLSIVLNDVSQPFTVPAVSLPLLAMAAPAQSPLPAILLGVWFLGFIGITSAWWVRWRRIRAAVRAGSTVHLEIPIRTQSSPTLLEPGVFGVFRPVLLLPEGILDRLTPAQLKGVVAHELCHVRHRDNLIAAVHMFVETVFWFHPLVWWIGKRMVDERERACDEEVLRIFGDRQAYAEGILNVCKLYVESPLKCVSGITGANLKRRIEAIMTNRTIQALNGGKKLLLAGAGTLAVAMPIVVGTMNAPIMRAQASSQIGAQTTPSTPKFEVVSLKPNKSGDPPNSNFPLGPGDVYVRNGGYFSATGFPLISYIAFAYKIIGNQAQYLLPQLPDWAKTERFDIQARAEGDPGKDQMRLMMRSLLADRFQLAVRYENREVPVFAFVLLKSGKTGPQLRPHSDQSPCPTEPPTSSTPTIVDGAPVFCNGIYPLPPSVPGHLRFGGRNLTIGFIADTFSAGTNLGRPMIDQTGLDGKFDFTLEWTQTRRDSASPDADAQSDSSGPSFEEALREQLGIKLQSQKGSIRVLVVDHVDRPSAN